MKAWSHLPNAQYIDWVLKSLKERQELWFAARDAVLGASRVSAWDAAMSAAWSAARDVAWDAAYEAAKSAAWAADWDAARTAVWVVARDEARGVISALVAYDDCDQFLNMPYEKLQVWAVLSEDPRAILLLPMVYVKAQLALLATV